jgi:SAM-dependent methyltransferase
VGTVLSLGPSPAECPPRRPVPAPNAARMDNHYLGGKDTYAADRALADRVVELAPVVPSLARAGRAFLRASARRLARAGLRQFLDVGCGLPLPGERLDEIVRRVDPRSRVAYTDRDPMVVCHARALLAVEAGTSAAQADLREPLRLLQHPEVRRVIDPDAPTAVFLVNVLPFVTDADDPCTIMRELLEALPPGSHVVVCHPVRTPALDAAAALCREADVAFVPRDEERIAGLLRGWETLPAQPSDEDESALPLLRRVGRKAA